MSEQEKEQYTEEREGFNEEPDVEAHKRREFDEPQLEEDEGEDVEAHRRR
jgi:hypothetical protein